MAVPRTAVAAEEAAFTSDLKPATCCAGQNDYLPFFFLWRPIYRLGKNTGTVFLSWRPIFELGNNYLTFFPWETNFESSKKWPDWFYSLGAIFEVRQKIT